MPILNSDVKALEWAAIAHLSEDNRAIQEIKNGLDQHQKNVDKFGFRDLSDTPARKIAKFFLFR